jgi:hypothetical protein
MTVKRALDVEHLLCWAYCDELPKRHTSSAEGIWNRLGRIACLGIDPGQRTGTAAQRYPPADDAGGSRRRTAFRTRRARRRARR